MMHPDSVNDRANLEKSVTTEISTAREYANALLDHFPNHPRLLQKIAKISNKHSASGLTIGKEMLVNQQIGKLFFPLKEVARENPKQKPLSLKAMRNLDIYLREKGVESIKP